MPLEKPELLESLLVGKQLTELTMYHVNESYFSINETSVIIDGGISLGFEDFHLAIGWSEEKELFDTTTDSILSLLGELDHFTLQEESRLILAELRGKKVLSVKVNWNYYQDFDDEFQPIPGERHVVEELILQFNEGPELQIATINYELDGNEVSEISYNLQSELLVTLDNLIEVNSVS